MSYAAHHHEFTHFASAAPRHSLLRRMFDAVFAWRQREAEREVGRFIARSGGHLTDDVERRMMERLTGPSFGHRG